MLVGSLLLAVYLAAGSLLVLLAIRQFRKAANLEARCAAYTQGVVGDAATRHERRRTEHTSSTQKKRGHKILYSVNGENLENLHWAYLPYRPLYEGQKILVFYNPANIYEIVVDNYTIPAKKLAGHVLLGIGLLYLVLAVVAVGGLHLFVFR